jgi:carboxyl-terminal processing protease
MNITIKELKKDKKKVATGAVVIAAIIVAFLSGRNVGMHASVNDSLKNPMTDGQLVSDSSFYPFWKAWRLIDEKYVGSASSTPQDKVYGAIRGLAESTGDPYTIFFPPEEAKMFESDIAGNFEGVGMEIDVKDGILTVISPLKNNPADKADVRTNDRIIRIDGKDTANMSVNQAVKIIRGPKGSTVTLTISRPGVNGLIEKKIVRDTIAIPTIETKTIGTSTDSIFVIHLLSFTADSATLFKQSLRSFVDSGSHKLILDLRGNPGGYLDAAWDMASYFLPTGDVVVTEDFGKKADPQVFRSKGYSIFNKNLQMIILADGGSASAAEILAGALREHGVAKIVGTKTFGKGSVQELIPLTSDTSIKITVARWLTPNGHNLSHDGLDPDVEVKVTEDQIKNHIDAQFNKAVEILSAKP